MCVPGVLGVQVFDPRDMELEKFMGHCVCAGNLAQVSERAVNVLSHYTFSGALLVPLLKLTMPTILLLPAGG